MQKEISFQIDNSVTPKNRIKIWVYSVRKNALAIIFCLFSICLVLFSTTNLASAKTGLVLWATAVVPSLFPFFVATELLSYTNVVSYLGKLLNPIMRPLFNVPGEGAFAFLMGLISGYPVGAKIVSNFIEDGICTKEEGERMLSFTNNSGPLFIIGTVGVTLFANTSIGILLFVTHILACISVGITLKIFSPKTSCKKYHFSSSFSNKPENKQSKNVSFSSLGEILGKSITNSISTVLMIGGFVVIFSVIISILNQSRILDGFTNLFFLILSNTGFPTELIKPLISGMVELTNGINLVSQIHLKKISVNIILCAFLLGFGGISVLLQVFSIISKSGLSIKKYAIRKIVTRRFCCFLYFFGVRIYSVFSI